ncbi:MAG: 3-dehydroquinate synthase [Spirochaetes bacterium]|nr:3-dehydroquinate synthase [Spirochaetota bacterium]
MEFEILSNKFNIFLFYSKESLINEILNTIYSNKEDLFGKKIVFIFDSNFYKNHKNYFIFYLLQNLKNNISSNKIYKLIIKISERKKNLIFYKKIVSFFLKNSISKNDFIFIFGGGVLLDLTGFVCSTYKRGIDKFIFIPTTLLSMVDASIGGKNGLNFKNIKNVIGTIFLPYKIFIFPYFIKTLKRKIFFSAIFEIIKYGLISDFSILENLLQKISILNKENIFDIDLLKKSILIKLDIIEKDLFDKNERKKLNFGHTFGHSIEEEYKIDHGISVGLGLIYEIILLYLYFDKNNFDIFLSEFNSFISILIIKNYSFIFENIKEKNIDTNLFLEKIILLIYNITVLSGYKNIFRKLFLPFFLKIKKGGKLFPLNKEELKKIFSYKIQNNFLRYIKNDKKI